MENKTTMALDELLEMPNVVCAKCGRALAVGSVVFTMVGTVEDFSYCDRDCAGIQNDRDDY